MNSIEQRFGPDFDTLFTCKAFWEDCQTDCGCCCPHSILSSYLNAVSVCTAGANAVEPSESAGDNTAAAA